MGIGSKIINTTNTYCNHTLDDRGFCYFCGRQIIFTQDQIVTNNTNVEFRR